MKLKKILCALLSAAMIASVFASALPVGAAEGGIRVSDAYQTSSRYDLGIAADNVRLSWELDAADRGIIQSAYRVVVSDENGPVWDSGWTESDEQTGIAVPGLAPETVYTWKVNVKDQNGVESGFSEEKTFETAPDQVEGNWIASKSLLRKTFTLDQGIENIERARSYIGSTSYMELRMNGSKVGDLVLSPKKPVPDIECYYNTYDILPYLQDGQNTVGVMVSAVNPLGDRAAGMIKITYKDGSTQVISTDTTWRASAVSEITRENLSSGEDVDANLRDGWDTNSYVENENWADAVQAGPISVDGQLQVPSDSGIYYSKQSFSGDYTVQVRVTPLTNAFGLVFGSGNPNPGMWQFNIEGAGVLRAHFPGGWTTVDTVASDGIQKGVPMDITLDVAGNTVTTSVNGTPIHTAQLADGQTSGPLGMRAALNESFSLDRIAVVQDGVTIFEDDFDTADRDKWSFPSSPKLSPSIIGTKVIQEVKPVSATPTQAVDKTRPYTENGELVMPENCGNFYTKQSFSGDYTIEWAAKTNNVCGFLFGSGDPNPFMWQVAESSGGSLRLHRPGSWGDVRVAVEVPGVDPANDWVPMKIDIKGNHVSTYIGETLVDEYDAPEGTTSGPLGFRITVAEDSRIDYVRVIQNGEVAFEDNFDRIDSSKWTGFIEPTTSYILDYGKNMQGYVKVDTSGPAGSTIAVKYAELLNEDGSINGSTTFHHPKCSYTLSGGQDSFEPRFFYTGFRYAEVQGVQGEFDPDDYTACFVSDDLDVTGTFSSSNQRLNQVFDMYYQSQRSNLMSNYTDCPQREKNGWTGDASVVKESSAMLLNDYTTAEAFMKTMYQDITSEGEPFVVVPWPSTDIATNAGFDITWTSAYFVFPYQTYMQTGDRYYIDMAYDSLVRVFDYFKSLDTDGDYLFTGNTYGDWLGYDNQEGKLDRGFLTMPYFYYCGALLSAMAEETGRDHAALDEYLAHMYDAIQTTYNKESYFSTETQTANAMALDFELVPAFQKEKIVETLVNAVSNADTTIKTGVLGTKSIYNALGEANEHKTLLDMTITPKKCSFGYMIDNGATTLWEYWDKAGETFNSHLTPDVGAYDSQNHAMMGGGPATWMFHGLGGITATSAGYKEITYRAGIESGLAFVNSSIDTVRGMAVSNWINQDGEFAWELTVPVNATAKIVIPVKNATVITESGADILGKDGNGLTFEGKDETGCFVYTAGSGSYRFAASDKPIPVDTDKTILKNVLDYAADAKAGTEYAGVIESVKTSFEEALAQAQAVYDNPSAAQQEVDGAWIKLMGEIHKLGFQRGDASQLAFVIEQAEAIDLNNYITAGQLKFTEALDAAKSLDVADALQDELDQAVDSLLQAMLNLRYKADKSLLTAVLAEAAKVDPALYTAESIAAFQSANNAAQAVNDNPDAEQAEVNCAVQALQEALSGLKPVESSGAVQGDNTKTTGSGNAKTGDAAPIAAAVSLLALAGAAFVIGKKKK